MNIDVISSNKDIKRLRNILKMLRRAVATFLQRQQNKPCSNIEADDMKQPCVDLLWCEEDDI